MANQRVVKNEVKNNPVTPIQENAKQAERESIAKQIRDLEASIESLTPKSSMTPERRSEAARKAQSSRTPEQKSEAAKKAWITIRAKRAARELAIQQAIETRKQLLAKLEELAA